MNLEDFLFSGEQIDHEALAKMATGGINDQLERIDLTGHKIGRAKCMYSRNLFTGFLRDAHLNMAFINSSSNFIKSFRDVGFAYKDTGHSIGDILPIEAIKTRPRLALEALKQRLDRGVL